jgi:steroid delta-isomerase-like uncharacterized protein
VTLDLRALFQRYIDELWNKGEFDAADELFTPDHVYHDPQLPGLARGPDGVRQRVGYYQRVFPGQVVALEDWVVQAGKTTCRWRYEGIYRGDLGSRPGSGQRVVIPGVDICHYGDGRISESWVQWDRAGVFEQINTVLAIVRQSPETLEEPAAEDDSAQRPRGRHRPAQGSPDPPMGVGGDPDAIAGQWAVIHQATGMVSVQLDVGMAIALVCLRSHASAAGRPLADVAADVVARRLRLA